MCYVAVFQADLDDQNKKLVLYNFPKSGEIVSKFWNDLECESTTKDNTLTSYGVPEQETCSTMAAISSRSLQANQGEWVLAPRTEAK